LHESPSPGFSCPFCKPACIAKFGFDMDDDPMDQIVIFPFMENYDDVGILLQYRYFIVRDILDDIINNSVNPI
jgi:hypothetical protein